MDLIERQDALDAICDNCNTVRVSCPSYPCGRYVALEKLPSAQPEQQHGKVFKEIVVEYPSYNPYPEYKGKPYFSIKYTENGQEFIGYGTYKPEVLSEYLKEYFMPSAQPETHTCDLISRQALMKEFSDFVRASNNSDFARTPTWNDTVSLVGSMPPSQPEVRTQMSSADCISRQEAIDAVSESLRRVFVEYEDIAKKIIDKVPSAQLEWNNHTVACLLAELFDDNCACNYNGIDEWLSEKCEVIDACPNPIGVACWEQFLKHRAERRTDDV